MEKPVSIFLQTCQRARILKTEFFSEAIFFCGAPPKLCVRITLFLYLYIYLPLFALIEMTSIWFRPGTICRIYVTKRSQIGTSRNCFVREWNAIFHPDFGNLVVMATGFLLSFLVVRRLKASCLHLPKSASGLAMLEFDSPSLLLLFFWMVGEKHPKFLKLKSWLKKFDFLQQGGVVPRRFWRPVGAAAARDRGRECIGTRCAANRSHKRAASCCVSVKSDPQ